MKYEEIENILQKQDSKDSMVQISFRNRNSIKGIFLRVSDYKELSRKNLWRIVSEKNVDIYKKTNSENLSKIFNGSEFTKLELLSK